MIWRQGHHYADKLLLLTSPRHVLSSIARYHFSTWLGVRCGLRESRSSVDHGAPLSFHRLAFSDNADKRVVATYFLTILIARFSQLCGLSVLRLRCVDALRLAVNSSRCIL